MGPLRGDGSSFLILLSDFFDFVEKMGPLRGDGSFSRVHLLHRLFLVEKMGPLRGDGNYPCVAKAEIPKQKVVTY